MASSEEKNEHFNQADSRMTYVKERGNLDN